jgi:anthranilate 1,2-dioxygenase small subunit
MAISPEASQAIDELQLRYVQALDTQNMEGWLATFADEPDSGYVCISEEDERRKLPLALMLDDCRGRLEDRVTFVTKIWAGTYQPYKTRHFVQRASCKRQGDGLYDTVSTFSITMIQEDGTSRVLTTGTYQDVIKVDGDQAIFKTRRAIYDANVLPQYLVFPL